MYPKPSKHVLHCIILQFCKKKTFLGIIFRIRVFLRCMRCLMMWKVVAKGMVQNYVNGWSSTMANDKVATLF